MIKQQQPGYILLVTFAMLALCTALVSAFMIKGLAHKRLMQTILGQEQIEQFARSTTALAQSLLSVSAEQDGKKEQGAQSGKVDEKAVAAPVSQEQISKQLLEKLLPVVNNQQTFMMKEITKDFPVVINLTFFCESGKINLNGLYDLVGKKFYNEGIQGKDKKVFAKWLFDKIAALTEKPSLLQPFIEHCKQRTCLFNDVTELLMIKEFAECFGDAIFYEGQKPQKPGNKTSKPARKLFLTDIFTVASEHDTIQPWLLSQSLCALLDIPTGVKAEKKQQGLASKKDDKKVDLSQFKQQADWQKDWDTTLKPRYEISYDKIAESMRPMLAQQFSMDAISMLAGVQQIDDSGQVHKQTGMFAILKQKKLPDDSITYDVIKMYQV